MSTETTVERLRSVLAGFAGKRVLAIGDLMLDEFVWGKVSRISPEAPVPVVNVTGESHYPGGAANVARNLRQLLPHVALMGIAGTDAYGCRLLELLRASKIETSAVHLDSASGTTVKTRIFARNQQVVRVDRDRRIQLTEEQMRWAMEQVDRSVPEVDAVVVADYGKGFLTQPLADYICRVARSHGKILTVDPHPHTSLVWSGATAIKPNLTEAFLSAGVPAADLSSEPAADELLLDVGARLLHLWGCGVLLLTLGEQGMMLFEQGRPPVHIPARAQDVFDVSGAGDTAIAVLTAALAAGASAREAAELANCAGGIVVGKVGTAVVTEGELRDSLGLQ
jgi:D-beta-D-heptose 7-phosphate kinase/D-beta-D-heptose 1-phosphate adenosyltransferase